MRNPLDALRAIERLVGGDFGSDMEWLLIGKEKVDTRLKQAAEIIGKIYLIAHSEVSTCEHPDWEKVKYEVLADPKD